MANSNPLLEMVIDGTHPEIKEHEVQVPALAFSGRIDVGFFKQETQPIRMAAVAYYLGSLGANGFIGAGFAFHPDQSPLWETIQEAAVDNYGFVYHGLDNLKKNEAVHVDASEIKLAESNAIADAFDSGSYVWSEPIVPLEDGEDGVTNAQGISFPSWVGLALDSRLGLSEIAAPASALPDLLFSLSFNGAQVTLPLQSLVLPELSALSDYNSTKVCIQRSASMLQRGTAAYAAPTTTVAEVARLQRLHGATGIPVYNMVDSPIVFGAMVLDALGPVVFDGSTKRTGVLKRIVNPSSTGSSHHSRVTCLEPPSCQSQQEYVTHWNTCQGTGHSG
ncbi:unnamed protein product [Phytophthora fragariaefolia]|uniref:Unnamed protein product n=1 Tax=Phytophthora fragariaefolia TaxID=1490495 RepID=A0A9W6WR86_9STRA|nr:unnamed protein product [Phytophthora fragariaefolia]